MFGHNDDTKNDDDHDMDTMVTDEVVEEAAAVNDSAVSPAYTPAAPGQPVVTPSDDVTQPVAATPASDVPPVDSPQPDFAATSDDVTDAVSGDGLLSIKQDALQQLSPLVGHLNQTPEEKFRTTMMMIQASDNQALIKDAYAAAQSITDDKTRAQALLDIINEINYFTRES